jgi:hypothetical protein
MSDFYISKMIESPIGHLVITDSFRVAVYKPINRFHRLMMKLCFGWTYEPDQKGGRE